MLFSVFESNLGDQIWINPDVVSTIQPRKGASGTVEGSIINVIGSPTVNYMVTESPDEIIKLMNEARS